MLNLKNKIVFITGASSGIGQAAASAFAALGARLILTARRLERIEQFASDLKKTHGVEVLALALDVQNREAVEAVVNHLPREWQEIDIVLNNAGLALSTDKMQDADPANWDTMIQTNLCGLLYVTHAILPNMVKRNSGHIINISSIAGHECYPAGNVYSATKHAVRALSKSLRLDLLGLNIRVSDVAPGAVNTEFSTVRWKDKARADAFYEGFAPLLAEDIADAVVYCATRPAHVDVTEIVMMPTAQASATQIHRDNARVL